MMFMNDHLRKFILTTALTMLAATTVLAQTPYDEGQKALREQSWMAAAGYFEEAFDSDQADAAMYWRAHALYKAGHRGDAARQIRDLKREYPESRWVKEAQALQIEYQGSIDDAVVEDELRLFALSQLMERDAERAMPLVMDIMRNTESASIRQDALFLLGMSGDPAAHKAIADIVRDSQDPELQAHAISILGVSGNEESLALLSGLYTDAADRRVKEAVIHAHMVAGEPGTLVDILRRESDPELQREIIHSLGAMEATEELKRIYADMDETELRKAVLESMMIAEDVDGLMQVLETEQDEELRAAAMQALSVTDDPRATQYLADMYPGGSREEKQAVIQSMMVMDDAETLISLLEREEDPELRREIVQMLSIMDSDAATDYLFEMLEKEG